MMLSVVICRDLFFISSVYEYSISASDYNI